MAHPHRTRILSIETAKARPDHPAIAEAAAILRAGGLVAFPTETVYGLGADATNPEAVARIFEAKGRPPRNPLIVHADGLEMAKTCVRDRDDWMTPLSKSWWPGPLTLVLYRSAIIPDAVTAGLPTVGIRVPAAPIARALFSALGRPVAAPSANRSSGISATTAAHVLKDLDGRIDLILDGGPTEVGIESTIVDLTRHYPRLLRSGPVSIYDLIVKSGLSIWPGRPDPLEEQDPLPSPGQMRVHYAPRTRTYWVEPSLIGRYYLEGRGA
ncbi:MAG TPA: L-threonylcarbamoyladenylate synthase, partial [Isosphaeraceae bacterium]|nr:L-threonylcarbamoyladenylate synthase [Isosphaeraceae bacterium]